MKRASTIHIHVEARHIAPVSTTALLSSLGEEPLHGLHVHRLVKRDALPLVKPAALVRIVDQDALGDSHHVGSNFHRHHNRAVAITAHDVAGADQHTAARNRLVQPSESDAAGDDWAATRAAG